MALCPVAARETEKELWYWRSILATTVISLSHSGILIESSLNTAHMGPTHLM